MKCFVIFPIFFMIAPLGCHVLNLEIEYTDDGLLQGDIRRLQFQIGSQFFFVEPI